MELFPYTPRPGQMELVDAARRTLLEGGHLVAESATGTGKTVAVLTAALDVAVRDGRRVLYLTRTNSQGRQVIAEVRAVRERGGLPLTAVALQGRRHLCTLATRNPEFGRASAEELATLCRDAQDAADARREGREPTVDPCEPYARTTPEALTTAHGWVRDHAPTAEELVDEMTGRGVCPYVVTREALPDAQLVVAPYVYLFQPFLRRALLDWMGATLGDILVVVDEAHNLPDHLRHLASTTLSVRSLERAVREAREPAGSAMAGEGDARAEGRGVELPAGGDLAGFLEDLREVVARLAEEHVPEDEEDALLPPGELTVELLSLLGTTSRGLEAVVKTMLEVGEAVRQHRRREGRTPRSYVGSAAAFLQHHRQADPREVVKLVVAGSNPALEVACLDPAPVAAPLLETAGSVHMSGTLQPLEEHRASLGLPGSTTLLDVPSPFPAGNRLVLYDPTVTTRYEEVRRDPGMWREIARRVHAIEQELPRVNKAVFFPSYDALRRVASHLPEDVGLVDERGSEQRDLMDLVDGFRDGGGSTLLSVLGGRISEGLDFPDDALELVVVVGLPYPRPTARERALRRFHDLRHGEGWAYAVHAPMARRVLQAVGRLIRSRDDRGVAVILDRRAPALDAELPGMEPTEDAAGVARRFLAGG